MLYVVRLRNKMSTDYFEGDFDKVGYLLNICAYYHDAKKESDLIIDRKKLLNRLFEDFATKYLCILKEELRQSQHAGLRTKFENFLYESKLIRIIERDIPLARSHTRPRGNTGRR